MDFDSIKINNNLNKTTIDYDKTKTVEVEVKQKQNDKIAKSSVQNSDKNDSIKNNSEENTNNGFGFDTTEEDSKYVLKGSYAEQLEKSIEQANKKLLGLNKTFSYDIHKATGRIIVKIKDNETGEVLREVPAEKDLDFFAKLQELAGTMIDEKR